MSKLLLTNEQWEKVRNQIPYCEDGFNSQKFDQIASKFPTNKMGYLTLLEIEKGFQNLGENYQPILKNSNVIMQSFQKATTFMPNKSAFVGKQELKYIFLYLYYYFHYYTQINNNNQFNDRINLQDFIFLLKSSISFVDERQQLIEEFNRISNGSESLSFDQFVRYLVDSFIRNGEKKVYYSLSTPVQRRLVRKQTGLGDGEKQNESEIIQTNQSEINQSYIFKPKFMNKKNKKEIVTYEALDREYQKKINQNKELRNEIINVKKELDIIKRNAMFTGKPNIFKTPKVKKNKAQQNDYSINRKLDFIEQLTDELQEETTQQNSINQQDEINKYYHLENIQQQVIEPTPITQQVIESTPITEQVIQKTPEIIQEQKIDKALEQEKSKIPKKDSKRGQMKANSKTNSDAGKNIAPLASDKINTSNIQQENQILQDQLQIYAENNQMISTKQEQDTRQNEQVQEKQEFISPLTVDVEQRNKVVSQELQQARTQNGELKQVQAQEEIKNNEFFEDEL